MSNQNQGASIEAAPCPFCGSENVKPHVYSAILAIDEPDAYCQCSDCSTTGPNGTDEASAIAAWNRRTPAAQVGAGELPPLPMTKAQYGLDHTLSFSAIDMREYARAAIEADRAQRAMCQPQSAIYQPSGAMCQAEWTTCPKCKGNYAGIGADGVENDCAKCENGMVRVSLAAPASAQPADHHCKWPMCQPEEVQQQVADQAYRELYSGAQPDQRESAAEITVDWPPCNPACDPAEGSDCRNRHCSCDAAKASVAHQLAASPAAQPAKDEQIEPSPMYFDAVKIVKEAQRASVSLVQRRLRISWNAARDMIELMLSRRDVPIDWAPPVYQLNVRQGQDSAKGDAE